eukprot:Hpha_TRINITY_DN16797_c4_g2::TRINITY_DN16797_c4_g2_i1::g.79005::m.79005
MATHAGRRHGTTRAVVKVTRKNTREAGQIGEVGCGGHSRLLDGREGDHVDLLGRELEESETDVLLAGAEGPEVDTEESADGEGVSPLESLRDVGPQRDHLVAGSCVEAKLCRNGDKSEHPCDEALAGVILEQLAHNEDHEEVIAPEEQCGTGEVDGVILALVDAADHRDTETGDQRHRRKEAPLLRPVALAFPVLLQVVHQAVRERSNGGTADHSPAGQPVARGVHPRVGDVGDTTLRPAALQLVNKGGETQGAEVPDEDDPGAEGTIPEVEGGRGVGVGRVAVDDAEAVLLAAAEHVDEGPDGHGDHIGPLNNRQGVRGSDVTGRVGLDHCPSRLAETQLRQDADREHRDLRAAAGRGAHWVRLLHHDDDHHQVVPDEEQYREGGVHSVVPTARRHRGLTHRTHPREEDTRGEPDDEKGLVEAAADTALVKAEDGVLCDAHTNAEVAHHPPRHVVLRGVHPSVRDHRQPLLTVALTDTARVRERKEGQDRREEPETPESHRHCQVNRHCAYAATVTYSREVTIKYRNC